MKEEFLVLLTLALMGFSAYSLYALRGWLSHNLGQTVGNVQPMLWRYLQRILIPLFAIPLLWILFEILD